MSFFTHIHGHWLDLVITRSTCDNIQMLTVPDSLSDHHMVIVGVNFSRTLVQSKHNVSYRPIQKIDTDAFKADILKSDLIIDPKGDLSDFCKQYYHVLKVTLFKTVPPLQHTNG